MIPGEFMKKRFIVTVIVFIVFFFIALTYAGAGEGKLLFISKCGQCHKSGGSAPLFAPTKYASKQWDRFFARNKHKRKKDISGLLKADEIEKIKNYLIDHAADSSQPEAAGLK